VDAIPITDTRIEHPKPLGTPGPIVQLLQTMLLTVHMLDATDDFHAAIWVVEDLVK
jgi:hypothetical protein